MRKRLLAMAMALVMAMSLLPMSALATEGNVAKIGDVEYATLDEAVTAAADGDTIELLADCETDGMNLSKNLTIQAAQGLEASPTITFDDKGIALWGKALTFRDCNVVMNGITSTPYAEWSWMAICASTNASLTLINTTMTMDGKGKDNPHAIYFCSNNKLNLTDYSTLEIKNYKQDAIEWDGGDGGYNLNLNNSTYISDHNRSGITGTFVATIINDSNVDVINSTGNGSNGTHYEIKNSVVNFKDNTDHGLSAGRLTIDNSTVTATGNGANGIHTNDTFTVKNNANVTIEDNDCRISSQWTIPGALHIGGGESSIDATSTVTIKNNRGSGILLKGSSLTAADGAKLDITCNTAEKLGYGGGVNTRGRMVLPADTILYNNHAGIAGDDIYVEETAAITFGKVGSDWSLDGEPNHCTDSIDGWYHDGSYGEEEAPRWDAHNKPIYVKLFDNFTDGTATVSGKIALKAAHGLLPVDPADPDAPEWDTSKSKTATNLDKNYESDVTLSLPAAKEELVSDVVFVLDKSTSAALEEQALAMLQNLRSQIAETNAKVKVGVVIFNKVANVTEFKDLATEYDAIEAAIKEKIESGTNTHAGLLAGKAMLDNDTSVNANRKYLVFVSDGITYMYNAEPTVTAWTFQADSWKNWAGPDNWNSKYKNNNAPADWNAWMQTVGAQVDAQGTTYEYPYGGTVVEATPEENWDTGYANSIDKALYLTNQVYQDAQKTGYHCYAMEATSNADYPWATSFMDYLADGKDVTFSNIQNDIYYLLDAGSTVKDVIGYGKDNEGNDYEFDFVNDIDNLTLTVGSEKQDATDLSLDLGIQNTNETARYGFGDGSANYAGSYPFVLHYYANGEDGKSDECFVWDINVPVSNFAPVQLTYTVKLTDPQTDKGTYGEYDADGSEKLDSLWTNKEAILYPVDSNGDQGLPEYFDKPTVDYTISGGNGGHDPKPDPPALNTKDHYGYIIGYPVDYYTGEKTDDQTKKPVKPQGNITRAEVATIFFRMLTDESRTEYWSSTNSYTDVPETAWYNNAVSTLSKAGIIDGYNDGSFKPNGKITRAEFATIAVRFFDVKYDGKDLFPDIDGHWAKDYINQAGDAGIVNGYPDGTFGPQKLITRAEAVTMVNRTLDRRPDADHFLKDMLVWPDNMDTTKWYYADMQEATNSHEYQMKGTGSDKYEVWTKMLPIRDWEAFEKEWSDAGSASNPGDVVR